MVQRIIDITETPQGLKISLIDTPDNRADLAEMMEAYDYDTVWWELLEPFSTNGSYSLLRPEWIGALTESPIIANEPMLFDEEELLYSHSEKTKVWYFPNYMVENELMQLLETGETYATLNN